MVRKSKMKIQCMACTPPTNWETDKEYQEHLVSFHGTTSADEAMNLERLKKKNSPVDLPPGIPQTAIPDADFIKTMNEIEKSKKETPPQAPIAFVPNPTNPPKIEPVILKYKYEGQDTCGNKVNTFELDADGKHFVVCYCLMCQKQIESREVVDLRK